MLGDKAKAQLSRTNRSAIALSFNQIGKDIPTFSEASAIVDTIKSSGVEFDNARIVYNKFISAISYEATVVEAFSEETFKNSREYFDGCQ